MELSRLIKVKTNKNRSASKFLRSLSLKKIVTRKSDS